MRETDKIDKLIKNKLKTSASPELDSRIDSLVANAEKKHTQTSNTWRIIMKNRITKFAAATVVAVSVLMSLTLFDKTVSPAYALEQAFEAMRNTAWMHIIGKQNELQQEYWISYPKKIIASKHSTGTITYQQDRMHYSYEKNNNILVISKRSDDAFEFLGDSPLGFIDFLKIIIKETEGEIKQQTAKYLNKKVVIYNMNTVRDGRDLSVELVVDFEKEQPLLLKMNQEGNDDQPKVETELHFDYPASGPQGIYALGVPEDVQVVDNMPPQEIAGLLSLYDTCRNNFSSNYMAVVAHRYWFDNYLLEPLPRQVDIIYRDGEKQRVDSYGIPSENKAEYEQDPVTRLHEMSHKFETLYSWWTQSSIAILAQIDLYDGKFLHQFRRGQQDWNLIQSPRDQQEWKQLPKVYAPNHNFRADDDIADLGWDVYLLSISNDPRYSSPVIIENDYSIKHSLICLETIAQGQTITDSTNKVWAIAPTRKRYYLNPQKDYLCQRFEQEEHFDASWQEDKGWYSQVKKEGINESPCVNTVREISQFGLTKQGQWYPVEIKQWNPIKPDDSLRVKQVYLNSDPVFPENIFNPKHLTK